MKLKKVTKSQKVSTSNFPFGDEDYYKTCRYCRYYERGRCYNPNVLSSHVDSSAVYDVAESGTLSGVLEETLHDCNTNEVLSELTSLLVKWKVSAKRVKEFEDLFNEMTEQWLDFTVKDKIDEAVSGLYQDHLINQTPTGGVEINNPAEFSCKEFM